VEFGHVRCAAQRAGDGALPVLSRRPDCSAPSHGHARHARRRARACRPSREPRRRSRRWRGPASRAAMGRVENAGAGKAHAARTRTSLLASRFSLGDRMDPNAGGRRSARRDRNADGLREDGRLVAGKGPALDIGDARSPVRSDPRRVRRRARTGGGPSVEAKRRRKQKSLLPTR
jgi:hypothetical protein